MASSPPGGTAVQRWVDQDPCFEGENSAHDVLAMCREGTAEGWPVLRALLRVALGDQFAQQTVLQVLLPGLLDPEPEGVRQGDRIRMYLADCLRQVWRVTEDERVARSARALSP